MILSSKEKQRLANSLSWMVEDLKIGFDLTKGNIEEGSQGGYSNELNDAIGLLKDIEKVNTVESFDSHGNSKSGDHRKSILLNCREFKCKSNEKGICGLAKITLESMNLTIGKVRCVQASDE